MMWYYLLTKEGSYEKIKNFFQKNIKKESLTLEELSSNISFLREYEEKTNLVYLEDFLEEIVYHSNKNLYQPISIADLQPNGLSENYYDFNLMILNKECYS